MQRLTLVAFAMMIGFGLLQTAEAGNGRGGNGGGNKFHAGGNQGVRINNFHRAPQHKIVQHIQHHNVQRHVTVSPRIHVQPRFHNYHLTHGRKFSFGYCYVGNVHTHWASTIFSPDYGCTVYYCPSTLCWYYWCPPHSCFYPVTHCPLGTYVF